MEACPACGCWAGGRVVVAQEGMPLLAPADAAARLLAINVLALLTSRPALLAAEASRNIWSCSRSNDPGTLSRKSGAGVSQSRRQIAPRTANFSSKSYELGNPTPATLAPFCPL